ncbi:PucR C-terminal helix-turn-helix domain-containing protein [Lactobacillus bombicola]|uniref:PucR C-terminal helix-turn-helix domain-containing protein n=1 Tax=Lactobacillus bombicola TaxID=1505723 RepID=A0A1I1STG1_9LACO|nr:MULTISPECIES: helix-turn-helix domain-containing protein [Lactobacillus]MCO6527510.1 helix-turn-helix domain-containing protein [Lactobacillus sp.]RMC40314.1 PucR family transcriptional regulator [Lactobacillus sp. ESL0233]SFD49632.1 PucR C-terminal helix-turn-helix domain-containing protein [Lactobacillus bombicola]
MLEKFMHEWLYVSDYDVPVADNGFDGRAKINGVDLDIKYIAVVASSEYNNLPEWRLAFNLDKSKRVYVMRQNKEKNFLTNLPKNIFIGIGRPHFDLSGSIKEALFALTLTNKFDATVYYDEVANMANIMHSTLDYPAIRKKLSQIDEDTQLTLWLYAKDQVSMSSLANILMVHPKTVEYRLQKIKTVTELDPHKGIDLLTLIVAFLKERTDKLRILETELQSFSNHMLPRDITTSLSIK